jgi:nucleotidyltransferase/DNA polymerase involved in DNA repair
VIVVSGSSIAAEIRARVFARTRLTASAGIGPNRMLSKICGEVNKPNGQFALEPDPQKILYAARFVCLSLYDIVPDLCLFVWK